MQVSELGGWCLLLLRAVEAQGTLPNPPSPWQVKHSLVVCLPTVYESTRTRMSAAFLARLEEEKEQLLTTHADAHGSEKVGSRGRYTGDEYSGRSPRLWFAWQVFGKECGKPESSCWMVCNERDGSRLSCRQRML